MNRLQSELARLFSREADARGVRCAVLELAAPSGWNALAPLWQGVQADLELPAPAIAVNGSDAYQLWFAFAQPLPPAQAEAFLASLRSRYLAGVPADRVRLKTEAVPPPVQVAEDRWSAFVTPDLAALFDEGPWLDLPPGVDAQADVLARLQAIDSKQFRRAQERLAPQPGASPPQPERTDTPGPQAEDPRRFLLQVMNDASVDLRLRIEAAKALLPGADGRAR